MIFSWFQNRRRKQLLAEPLSPAWRACLAKNVRHYGHVDDAGKTRIEQVVRIVVAEKDWVGGGGFELTEEMKVTIAGQAAVLVLGLDEPYYFDRLQSIIVYDGAYQHPAQYQDQSWIVREGEPILGESWHRGPIVLSWRDVLAAGRNTSRGHNLVVHEFAHYLDGLDGEVDGIPPLPGRERALTWYRVTEAEYLRLLGEARRNAVSLLDHYGASNKAEFFAVASECFFEQPHAMQRRHGELYGVLRDFYFQNLAEWLPDARVAGHA